MYRKLRKDIKEENKQEKEAAYQKRVSEMENKDKNEDASGGDWMSSIKGVGID